MLFHLEKMNQEIMAALRYKPQPQWKMGKKKIQAATYNGTRTVFKILCLQKKIRKNWGTYNSNFFFFQEETIHCDLLGLFVNIWYNTIEHQQCNTIANSLASHYTHKCLVCSALILLSEEKISDLRVNKACHKTDGGCSSSTALPA